MPEHAAPPHLARDGDPPTDSRESDTPVAIWHLNDQPGDADPDSTARATGLDEPDEWLEMDRAPVDLRDKR